MIDRVSYGLLTFEIHRGTVISDAFLLYGLDFTSVTFTLILQFVLLHQLKEVSLSQQPYYISN